MYRYEMAAESHLSEIYMKLYIAFLKSFIYDDVAFEVKLFICDDTPPITDRRNQQDNATELTLGTAINGPEMSQRADSRILREDEILAFGMPERRLQVR